VISKKVIFDKSWTLFLDRDGVINKRLIDDYVCRWEQFEFLPNVLDALKTFSPIFKRIIIVTNQQGIGKGLMTDDDLSDIHKKMLFAITKHGGKIDKIYFCPDKVDKNNIDRKPNIGMALKAIKDFPEINLNKSIMVGDSLSDLKFGFKLKMINIFISDDISTIRKNSKMIDYTFRNLFEFSVFLKLNCIPSV
jgi:histidinol-phosphate phosphatase family protein